MNVESEMQAAVSELTKAGLVARYMQQASPWIQGGTHSIDSSVGPVIKNTFGIEFENSSWIARVPGEGQLQNEQGFSNIDEAVRFVIKYFESYK